LPPAQQGLAPVLAGLARSGAYRGAEAALERPRVQKVWVETTTATQRQLVELLDDKSTAESEGGNVVLDLRPITIDLRRPDRGPRTSCREVARVRGKITIVEESQLETAAIVAGALLVLILVAPVIARGWVMLVVLVALVAAGVEVVRGIVQREAQQPG